MALRSRELLTHHQEIWPKGELPDEGLRDGARQMESLPFFLLARPLFF